MAQRVFLMYPKLYTYNGEELCIGGVQTYIQLLLDVIHDLNLNAFVYQYGDVDFIRTCNHASVIGVDVSACGSVRKKKQKLLHAIEENADIEQDLLIFCSDVVALPTKMKQTISIQHGIYWDIQNKNGKKSLFADLKKWVQSQRIIQRVARSNVLVCVDYNFINWYRTQTDAKLDYRVIPNCSVVPHRCPIRADSTCTVLFSRRFVEFRGTRVFCDAIERVLSVSPSTNVIVAGSGPDEDYMRLRLNKYKNIYFTSYSSKDSLAVHGQCDIAVVPTKGSEGTSLSLLEAMASGCAVIATDVGGLTNVLINEHNGLMVRCEASEISSALLRLIEDKDLRTRLSNNAYQTVNDSFNFKRWAQKWKRLIVEMLDFIGDDYD